MTIDLHTAAVLDRDQLNRIEGVHRGFFYQHLYAVALLLALGRQAAACVSVELDEDVEFTLGGKRTYIQVKTRQEPLTPNDVTAVLERFDRLRSEHHDGKRTGTPAFAIVCNAEPGPKLAKQLAGENWSKDVAIVTPQRPDSAGLPLPGVDVDAMIAAATLLAQDVPFAGIAPSTIVFKLASMVQHAAAGARDHRFAADDLPALLEQLVIQLQDFPEPPSPYRPQRDEPPMVTPQRVRLIVGFSGAGKTAWAAEAARHSADTLIYFDVGDLPSRAVPTNLAREIVARFLGGREAGVGGVQLPPNGGADALRYADALLVQHGMRATVVLDNVHRLAVEDLRQIMEAAPRQSFVGLGQPWPDRPLVEATLGVCVEELGGFGPDTVAAIFAGEGVGIDPALAEAVIGLTGGLPLFVINAARLSASDFAGSAATFCASILARTHQQDTAQDLILEGAFAALSVNARHAAGLLGVCDVPLDQDETAAVLKSLGSPLDIAQALRELRRASMIVNYAQHQVGLHDALRPLAAGHRATVPHATIDAALERLQMLLIASLSRRQDITRLTFLIRLLPRVGRTDALVDLATSEMFYEQGNMAMMWDTLVAAAADPSYTPRDRFWALDALAYWESRDGGTPDRERVDAMAALVAAHDFASRERLNLIFKQLVIAGTDRDRQRIEHLYRSGRKLIDKAESNRILRFNRAVALYRAGALAQVRNVLEPLIDDMFKLLGFSERALFMTNGKALGALLGDADPDDVKRLADALNLWATVVIRLNMPPLMRRIQASKLYAAVGAGRSAAIAAQEMADEMLKIFASAEGAREVFEQHIFPLIEQYQLTDLALEARAEYAVALAYDGDFGGAVQQMQVLANYDGGADWAAKQAYAADLIERIRDGTATLGLPMRPPGGRNALLNPNAMGRRPTLDAPCPCGSGRKYKRCHGKTR